MESGIRELFSRGILNPEVCSPESSSRNPESANDWNPDSISIEMSTWNVESSNWNPESTVWNPESKTVLDYLTCGEKSSNIDLHTCGYLQVQVMLIVIDQRLYICPHGKHLECRII